MSRAKAWIPPVVGRVKRTRNKISTDPDGGWMESEHHFEQAPDGRYDKVIHTEEYSVDVVRLPCGHDVPNDQLQVEFDQDPEMDAFLEGAATGHGEPFAVFAIPDGPPDMAFNSVCPRCGQKHRLTSQEQLDFERMIRETENPRTGWV